MSDVSETYQFNLPILRTVCLPKRVFFTQLTYAPLISFILGVITQAGHVILFPYYLLVILSRGRPPKALYYWVYFNSAYIYGAIHEKEEVWHDFWCLYFVYIGYIVAFVNWVLTIVSVALIFPIFIYIEEWKLLTNVLYRFTFGNWKRIVNECDDIKYKNEMKKRKTEDQKQKQKESIRSKSMHSVTIVDVEEEEETKKTIKTCQTCGEKIDTETTYCPKCGSYIGN